MATTPNIGAYIPPEYLDRYGVSNPANIKIRYIPNIDPETGQNVGDTQELYDATNGKSIPGAISTDAKGNPTYLPPITRKIGGGDFLSGLFSSVSDLLSDPAIRFLAPAVLQGVTMGLGGAAGVGNAMGIPGTAGEVAGGAALGAGKAALTGGNPLTGALTGGVGGLGGVSIGDTGYTVGDVLKGVNAVKSAQSGNFVGALTGAAKLPGVSDVIKTLTDAGLSGPETKDFIEGYFAPGGEGYIAPATGDGSSGTNMVNGYIDQTNGHWIDTSSGKEVDTGKAGPLTNDNSGNLNSMKDWSFDQTSGQWTHTDPVTGETIVYDYTTPITGKAQTGADIEKSAGATATTSTTSTTKTTPTTTTKPTTPTTPTTPSATSLAALAAASWYGINPADLVKADKNDVLHIKSFKELFGHDFSAAGNEPAPSAQDHNISKDDILQALEDTQNYAGGGDIHALLQLLRS